MADKTNTAYIAFGANLGNRRSNLQSALAALNASKDIEVLCISEMIETEPEGAANQGRYLNAAASLVTSLSPGQLLKVMLEIEISHGRDRSKEKRWGPRLLDLDLLMYEDLVIDQKGLTLPHPRMHKRAFVLGPLAEIAGQLVHPVRKETITALLEKVLSHARVE
ncbi:MAG: 2-amino-4-hydroxy-6-hydroxymethyldihydropteridine diphosphokinase [Planctomycetes bacterium]|nr:2-amino-4-hydroxy-6-hydroxymethyldihydropteridine diphosphokinase [Planctomycetota bacterium]